MGSKLHDLADMRREYHGPALRRADLASDPIVQFERWFREATASGVPDANAMTLATADVDGQPSSRTVLLKSYDQHGFVFFTNHRSRKARDMDANPRVALLFYWPLLYRQVQIRGHADHCSAAESEGYFLRRPRDSQLSAWASPQSTVIVSREALEQRLVTMRTRFGDTAVPCPSFWGGYRVVAQQMEFWQGQKDRLHDRFIYLREQEGWRLKRLAP